MLISIQALRGAAAILVVLFHTHLIIAQPKYLASEPFGGAFSAGYMGVDIFFVLSGFIIMHAHRTDIGVRSSLRRYAHRRFIRLFPIYWIYLTGMVILLAVGVGTWPSPVTVPYLASAYSLVRFDAAPPPLSVAWSLFHEVLFYGFFALLLVNKRVGTFAFCGWLVFILGYSFVGTEAHYQQHQGFFGVLGSLFNLNFFLGMLAYKHTKSSNASQWKRYLPLSLCLFSAGIAVEYFSDGIGAMRFLFAAGAYSLIVGLVKLEKSGGFLAPRGSLFLGDASYSIYLVHTPLLSALIKVAMATGLATSISSNMLFLGIFIITTALSAAAYPLVERPLLKWMRRRSFAISLREEAPRQSRRRG